MVYELAWQHRLLAALLILRPAPLTAIKNTKKRIAALELGQSHLTARAS